VIFIVRKLAWIDLSILCNEENCLLYIDAVAILSHLELTCYCISYFLLVVTTSSY
jgi:hypothetical protein